MSAVALAETGLTLPSIAFQRVTPPTPGNDSVTFRALSLRL